MAPSSVQSGLCKLVAEDEGEHHFDTMSLIASTRGVALLPACAENFLPWFVTRRPLSGEPPTIDPIIGYNKTNTSPILKLFLSRVDQLKKRAPRTH